MNPNDPITGLRHMALDCACEWCGGKTRIMSTWIDADGKYMCVTTCRECDAPSPDEPFAD